MLAGLNKMETDDIVIAQGWDGKSCDRYETAYGDLQQSWTLHQPDLPSRAMASRNMAARVLKRTASIAISAAQLKGNPLTGLFRMSPSVRCAFTSCQRARPGAVPSAKLTRNPGSNTLSDDNHHIPPLLLYRSIGSVCSAIILS